LALRWFGVSIVAPSLSLVLIVHLVLGNRVEPDPQKRIDAALASGNVVTAMAEYRTLIEGSFHNLEWHRGYIRAHLEQPKYQGKHKRRDDGPVLGQYRRNAESADPRVSDIGNYGLGYFYSIEGDYAQAIQFFGRVRDQSLPYLNNSIGYAHKMLGRPDRAEENFRREIALGGNVDGATSNLARLLDESRRFDELSLLASDPRARKTMDADILRHLDLVHGRYFQYARDAIQIRDATPPGLLGAALVLIVWFLYLRRIDVFEPERVSHAGLMTVAGMAFSLLAVPLYDLFKFGLGFTLTGHYLNDLLFCIFGIGLIEETVKLAPVLLALRFTSVMNESVDYLVYGSLSGLGFAFMENLIYFDDRGLRSIASRGFSAVLLHMSLTAMVMYGLVYGRRMGRKHPALDALMAFGAVCVVHGVYDFWLVAAGWVGQLSMLSFLILIVAIRKYGRALNIAMNLSEHMSGQSERRVSQVRWLCGSLAAIVMLQYLLIALKYGAANAEFNLLTTVGSSYILILLILLILGRFTVTKGKWLPLFD
jgi:RsiW-degrading membrane proteinase PrsW (M82 family)